jgi:hypothetical protein
MSEHHHHHHHHQIMENVTSLIEATTEMINTTIASVTQGSTHIHDHHGHHHHMAHGTTGNFLFKKKIKTGIF